jgi:hypothetical protein
MKAYFNIEPYDILLQFSMLRTILQPPTIIKQNKVSDKTPITKDEHKLF